MRGSNDVRLQAERISTTLVTQAMHWACQDTGRRTLPMGARHALSHQLCWQCALQSQHQGQPLRKGVNN